MYHKLFSNKFIKLNIRYNSTRNRIPNSTHNIIPKIPSANVTSSLKYKYPVIGIIFVTGGIIEYVTFKDSKNIRMSTGLGWATIVIFLCYKKTNKN